MIVQNAAKLAAVLLSAVAVFQAALALGAPWGDMSYGGQAETTDGVLPTGQRIMSAAAVLILLFAGWVVLARAEVLGAGPLSETFLKAGSWVIFGYLVLNTTMNLMSSHPGERWGMGTTTFVTAIMTFIVASS